LAYPSDTVFNLGLSAFKTNGYATWPHPGQRGVLAWRGFVLDLITVRRERQPLALGLSFWPSLAKKNGLTRLLQLSYLIVVKQASFNRFIVIASDPL